MVLPSTIKAESECKQLAVKSRGIRAFWHKSGLVINGVYMEWWEEKAQNVLCLFELPECLLHRHPACLGKKCTAEQKAPVLKTCG